MRILLIEDEIRMAQALCEILRLEKYEVDHYANGFDGLAVTSVLSQALMVFRQINRLLSQAVNLASKQATAIMDATAIQQKLANLSITTFDEQAADVNNDGLNIIDATAIQLYLAHYDNPYNIGEIFVAES